MVAVHLPLDFERRASVRLLGHKLSAPFDVTVAIALRIWMDWALSRTEFRPLKHRPQNDTVDWAKEDISYVIETAAYLQPNPGFLLQACLDAGFIRLEQRAETFGLVLDGFWDLNEHLSPDHKSMQQRGGLARHAYRMRDESAKAAEDRKKIFEKQGIFPFGNHETTEKEQELCYALLIRLYRICGLETAPQSSFTEATMVDALFVVRNFTLEQITKIEEWILDNRENPEVVKIPERILSGIGDYAAKAGAI